MNQSINAVALLVKDYDEAIEFYTTKLNFTLIEDTALPDSDKRWVIVAPNGRTGANLLLAKADGEQQLRAVGDQAGGRVWLFLETDDFWRAHASMIASNVTFNESPRKESYGTVAVFKDLYGNLWDLIERYPASSRPSTSHGNLPA